MNFWWFGINNLLKPDGRDRPVILGEFLPALASTGEYWWPKRGNDRTCYPLIRPGDLGLLWTGHSPEGSAEWGVLGLVTVADSVPEREGILLRSVGGFEPSITPYPQGAPRGPASQTTTSAFLWSAFGSDFEPLHDVFSWLGYLSPPRRSIKTIYPVPVSAFLATLQAGRMRQVA